jgi:multimeric flavodoxin WrbA
MINKEGQREERIMVKKILVINGSPVKNGNTATLVNWFCEGAREKGAQVEVVNAAFLKYKSNGCISCRRCQKIKEYKCVIPDEAQPVLEKMARADVIVMATPLYFYGPSAQLKLIMDRMFSLYKWDNKADTMETPLKGKTFALIASAFEDVGLDNLEKPFAITADYSGMKFESLVVANAGESGEVEKIPGIRQKAVEFGKKAGI